MELITKEIEQKLLNAPLGSTDGMGMDAPVIVKFFNPCGIGTYLVTEGEKQPDGDWLLFGYCHLFEWEWGYITLEEIKSVNLPFGLTFERDLYVKDGATVKDLYDGEPQGFIYPDFNEGER